MLDGRPLVGPSGRVFNQLLRCANIDRKDCLVTNVFDTQAPENDVLKWTASKSEAIAAGWPLEFDYADRYFEPRFRERAFERLARELDSCRPAVIVPLGATALWALTGHTAISVARGAVDRATRVAPPGTKILPTFHPAHVLRQWKFFHIAMADIMKAAAETALGNKISYTERHIWIEPSLKDLANFATFHLSKCALLSVDIETMPSTRQITCIGFAPSAATALVVPFVDWRKPSRSYWADPREELAAWTWVEAQLQADMPKLMQNGTYDWYWLLARMGIGVRNYCEDTRLLHHSLYPEMPKDLAFMGATYAQAGPWKRMNTHSKAAEGKRDA